MYITIPLKPLAALRLRKLKQLCSHHCNCPNIFIIIMTHRFLLRSAAAAAPDHSQRRIPPEPDLNSDDGSASINSTFPYPRIQGSAWYAWRRIATQQAGIFISALLLLHNMIWWLVQSHPNLCTVIKKKSKQCETAKP